MSINDWTRSETISAPDNIVIQYKNTKPNGQVEDKEVDLRSTTRSSSETTYVKFTYNDADGVQQEREVQSIKVDRTENTIASVNQTYIAWRLTNDLGLPVGNAVAENISKYEYAIGTDGPVLVREVTEQYISMAQFCGGLAIESYSTFQPSGSELILSERTIREIKLLKADDGREVTRTSTSRWMARGVNDEGKQELARWYAANRRYYKKTPAQLAALGLAENLLEILVSNYIDLVFEGTEVQIETGRMPVPSKPSDQALAADEVINGIGELPSDATPEEAYGSDTGWWDYVPDQENWQQYTEDKNGDGLPDWNDYVPQSWEDYDQDSDGDGEPDWAPYIPTDWEDYDQDSNGDGEPDWAPYVPTDWQEFNTDTDNDGQPDWAPYVPTTVEQFDGLDTDGDGVPDWAPYVPVGSDFDTGDSEFNASDTRIDNEYTISGVALLNGAVLNEDSVTTTATYEMPFAPDDYPKRKKRILSLIRGHARDAAVRFGRVQSAMDVGHAYGQNIVTGWNEIPTRDLSPVYIRLAGIEGAFLTDSLSYAWGPEGMVVSSDLMLLGVSGYSGLAPPSNSWLQVPVPAGSLQQVAAGTVEANPVKANSIAIPGGFDVRNPGPVLAQLPSNGHDVFRWWTQGATLIGPTQEVESYAIFTRPYLRVREVPYALDLGVETATITTGPIIVGATFSIVTPPAGAIGVGALPPAIATGSSITVPAGAVVVTGIAPAVVLGIAVEVPAASIAVAAIAPDLIGRLRIEVAVPAAVIQISAADPVVLTGTFLEVPAAAVTLAGLAPTIDTFGDGDGATPGAADLYGATQDWQAETWAA